jgi:hypothetical protein
MNVSAVLVEQLEPDGHLLTFQMRPEFTTSMTVAFANEYAEPRVGPFHFLDPKDEQSFKDAFATGKVRKLAETRFKSENGLYRFHTSWIGIPTTKGELTGSKLGKIMDNLDDNSSSEFPLSFRRAERLFDGFGVVRIVHGGPHLETTY